MELKSFDSFLTELCDNFDEAISPKVIERTNTNIIYLLFKAIAKGLEIINNLCVVVHNKFNPESCSDEDLVSVAHIVGTERRSGTASGLHIFVSNNTVLDVVLRAGVYTYALSDDLIFEFEVISDTTITANSRVSYIAMSREVGRFPVTEQSEIRVESEQAIPEGVAFSCSNNASLLGSEEESLLDFRNRILKDYTRQESMKELEERIRNLPYIFDCKIVYNNTDSSEVVGAYTLPPMTCAIFYSGEAKRELADIIASYIICPTLSDASAVVLKYESSVFINGYHEINIIPFTKLEFKMAISYRIDDEYVNADDAKIKIESILKDNFAYERHLDYIKEEDVYNVLSKIDVAGVEILAVSFRVNDSTVPYIEVPQSQIAELTDVIWD